MNVPEAATEVGGEAQVSRFTRGRVLKQLGATNTDCVSPPLARFELRHKLDALPSQTLSYRGSSGGLARALRGGSIVFRVGNA